LLELGTRTKPINPSDRRPAAARDTAATARIGNLVPEADHEVPPKGGETELKELGERIAELARAPGHGDEGRNP